MSLLTYSADDVKYFLSTGLHSRKNAMKECLEADCKQLTGVDLGLLRAINPKKDPKVWGKIYGNVDTIVCYGQIKNVPTMIIRHGDNVCSTPEGLERLIWESKTLKFRLDPKIFLEYFEEGSAETGLERKTWVIQGSSLNSLFSGEVDIDKARDNTALVPLLGNLAVVDGYLKGFRDNNSSKK